MLKLVRSLFLSYLFALFDFNLFSIISGADVLSYHGMHEEQLSCNKIKIYEDIGCICVTGLWRFYSDCSSFYSLAGNSHCFSQIPKAVSSTSNELKDVSYAMEILPSPHFISLVRGNIEVLKLDAHDDERELLASIKTEDLIVTGSRHTAKGPRGSVCFSPQENAYCTYRQPMDLVGGVLQNITMGCREDVPFVAPIFCDFIKAPQRCEDIPAPAPHELSSREDDELNEVEVKNEKTSSHLVRPKRKTHARNGHRRSHSDRSLSPASPKFGRTFLNAPGQNFETVVPTEMTDLDEDYLSAEILKNMTGLSHDAVLSEIWNYVETQAEIVMGLKKPLKNEIDYDVPYFKLLHLSKKVMQKVCPPSYVQPTFFDIATQAFIQVQVKRLIYEPPNANFPGFKRIVTALEKCIENATMFPFLTLDNVNATVACDPNTLGNGQFAMFNGTALEISITNTFIGLNKDPIIEAVWKIFYLAQSQCFPFFKEVSFNDHHRYTAWLTPLFQNDITEIWTGGKSTIWTYGQFLGNLEEVMTKVAYCAASSRFSINKVAYPWELPRPVKEPPKPPLPPVGRRKKRSITNPLTKCLDEKAAESCFSTAKRFTSVSPSVKEVKNSPLHRKQGSTVRPDAVKSADFLTSIVNYM